MLKQATIAGLSGLSIFIALSTLFLSAFLLAVPVIYDKYDKFHGVARALRELRVGFICNGAGAILNFIAACVFLFALSLSQNCTLSRCTIPALTLEVKRQSKPIYYRFATTISAWTQDGCKDASTDPSAKTAGKQFVAELPDWCRTKKAGAAFFWFCTSAFPFFHPPGLYQTLTLIPPSRLGSSSCPHLPRIPHREEDISSTRPALRAASHSARR